MSNVPLRKFVVGCGLVIRYLLCVLFILQIEVLVLDRRGVPFPPSQYNFINLTVHVDNDFVTVSCMLSLLLGVACSFGGSYLFPFRITFPRLIFSVSLLVAG